MILVALINFCIYSIKHFDVYDYNTGDFMYTTDSARKIGLDTYVRRFGLYNPGEWTSDITLEIYI